MRRCTRLTKISGKRIDRIPSLMVFVSANAQAQKGKVMDDEDEPDDEFTALDEVLDDDRPLPKPCLKPLTHGQRVQLLASRYERGLQLFHPLEYRRPEKQ